MKIATKQRDMEFLIFPNNKKRVSISPKSGRIAFNETAAKILNINKGDRFLIATDPSEEEVKHIYMLRSRIRDKRAMRALRIPNNDGISVSCKLFLREMKDTGKLVMDKVTRCECEKYPYKGKNGIKLTILKSE